MCSVKKGQAPFSFKWYKNGNIVDGSSKEMTNDKISTLVIDPVKADSAGNYTCVVSNSHGSSSYSSILIVKCKLFKTIKYNFTYNIFLIFIT